MRLLMLGGASFVGRLLVEAALRQGWHVTMLNRDRPTAPGAEHLYGDRTHAASLDVLRGRAWDLVADTWQGPVAAVRESARLLVGSADTYAYVSSLTVYRDTPGSLVETGATRARRQPGPAAEEPGSYAERKANAEQELLEAFGSRALIVRPGVIIGPWENVGRLPWWLLRARTYPDVLAPGPPDRPVQYVDVRDLAQWILHASRQGVHGCFNLACPRGHATMSSLLEICRAVTGARARLRWVPQDLLLRAGVTPWAELPLWVPERAGLMDVYDVDVSRAIAQGARFRDLSDTVRDTWSWLTADPAAAEAHIQRRPWLTRPREEDILTRYRLAGP